eukprot:TRINITY_DN7815_c0_g1_i2.p1 TRINITY_DN7815_c0_g1~~TRINITY_DN7815_c0_g1_i2.p1  ORF type:complete len:379 (-),score=58.96 TRINITY_DN7815_c0_g1_i2:149-1285(-)
MSGQSGVRGVGRLTVSGDDAPEHSGSGWSLDRLPSPRKRLAEAGLEAPSAKRLDKFRPACNACHRAKVKCDGKIPCGRCLRGGRECEPRHCTRGRPTKEALEAASWSGLPEAFISKAVFWVERLASSKFEGAAWFMSALALQQKHLASSNNEHQRIMYQRLCLSGLLQAMNLTPRALHHRATESYYEWQGHRAVGCGALLTIEELAENLPTELGCTQMKGMDPAMVRVTVLGQAHKITNSPWEKRLRGVAERDELVASGKLPNLNDAPLAHVLAPSELGTAFNTVLPKMLQALGVKDEHGEQLFTFQHEMVALCIDRDSVPFMGLCRISHFMLCHGAITIQVLSVTSLPRSKYVTVPEQPSLFQKLKGSVSNLSLIHI